ncbi:MAG: cation diffusion facilitator family transporter [Acidimicrobiia bacterium]
MDLDAGARRSAPHLHATHAARRRALVVALGANAAFLVVQVVGGLAFSSLALLADAAHMVTDVAALGIALLAQQLLTRPATARHSYGLQRAEVLGAQVNGLILLVASAWIFWEAAQRVGDPPEVVGGGVVAVGLAGLAVNLGSLWFLVRSQGHSLNMRGAAAHMAADAAGSAGAVVAGLAVLLADAAWADPAMSFLIGGLVLWSAWTLLRDATNVLLEGTPRGTDPRLVEAALAGEDGVAGVHHLHVWTLASEVPSLSAHVVLTGTPDLHEAQGRADRLKAMLEQRFGIAHATLELECHGCQPPPDGCR